MQTTMVAVVGVLVEAAVERQCRRAVGYPLVPVLELGLGLHLHLLETVQGSLLWRCLVGKQRATWASESHDESCLTR